MRVPYIPLRRNPPLFPNIGRRAGDGRPNAIVAQDEQTGEWVSDIYLTIDDYGTQVDSRGEGGDYFPNGESGGPGLASMDIQTGSVFDPFPGGSSGGSGGGSGGDSGGGDDGGGGGTGCAPDTSDPVSLRIDPDSASVWHGTGMVTFRIYAQFADTGIEEFEVTDCPIPATYFTIDGAPLAGENLAGNVYSAGAAGDQTVTGHYYQNGVTVDAVCSVHIA